MTLTLFDDDGNILSERKVTVSEFTFMGNGNAEWVSPTVELRKDVMEMLSKGVRLTGGVEKPAPRQGSLPVMSNVVAFKRVRSLGSADGTWPKSWEKKNV